MKKRSFFLIPLLLSAACAPSVDDICERLAQCGPGTPDDVEECKQEGKALQDQADSLGCGSEFDDYLSCVDGLDVCDEEAVENGCVSELAAVSACGDEQGEDDPPAPG